MKAIANRSRQPSSPPIKRCLMFLACAGFGLGLVRAGTPDSAYTLLGNGEQNGFTLDPAFAYDSGSGSVLENIYETLLTYKGKSLQEFEPNSKTPSPRTMNFFSK